MQKVYIKLFCLLIGASVALLSCKKNSDDPTGSDNTLLISANQLVAMIGEDWNALEPQLNNKRGYWYTEFTQDQSLPFKAAISLPCYDTTDDGKTNCSLLLNVDRSNNKVTAISMNTVDSLSPISKKQSFDLETAYYTNGLKPLKDTVSTNGFYDDGTGFQATISTNEALSKLNNDFNTPSLGIYYITTHSHLTIMSFKNQDNNRYTFTFNGFGQ